MKQVLSFVTAMLTLVCLAPPAPAWEIPLNVEEQWAQGGPRQVSGGVPLLVGQAKEADELRLAVKGPDGKLAAVPAQFRVLARWWRADNSIRWVLVDFTTVLGNVETKTFYLTNEKLDVPAPPAALTVEETADAINVSTGPAQFTMNRKKFAFIDKAVVNGVDLIEASPDSGTVFEDTFGDKYYSSEGTKSVDVVEKGPMRVCVRARGIHKGRDGKGYSAGMYQYDVFMNFYPGSSAVYVDLVVDNCSQKPIGEVCFKDASLFMRLKGGASGYRIHGGAPLDGSVGAGDSVYLYQDSNGTETWQRCQGYTGPDQGGDNFPPGIASNFRGYKIFKRSDGKEETLLQGDQARGLAHIYNGRGGVVMHTRDFWQQFPKAVGVYGDGRLQFGIFPREYKLPHYMEDCSGKGHELYFLFYAKGKPTGYATDEDGRPWPHVFADCWEYDVHPRPPIEHMAATGALGDLGPYTVPTAALEDYELEIRSRRLFMADKFWGNGYGWQVFGETWQSFGGHSTKGARQPIKEDDYLFRWYVTGRRNWLVAGQRRSRNFRDVRTCRVDDQDSLAFTAWNDFAKAHRSEQWTGRPMPSTAEAKKYAAGRWYRHEGWELPNPEHMTLDLIYDRHLLFGDIRAFENMRTVAGHGGIFRLKAVHISRDTGWCWRTIERYWELTGDKSAEAALKDTAKKYENLIGKAPLWCGDAAKPNEWFTQVWSRAVAMTALHTGDPQMLELAKTVAEGKDKRADYFCTLYSVLYRLTGDEKYKDTLLKKTNNGRSLLRGFDRGGDFPMESHWLVTQPPLVRK